MKDIRLEMTLFDKFGPLARDAIRATPKDFNLAKLFSKFSRPMVYAGVPRRPDLMDPQIDAIVADFVNQQTIERFGAPVDGFKACFKKLPDSKGLIPPWQNSSPNTRR